jgi:hypothetical protein
VRKSILGSSVSTVARPRAGEYVVRNSIRTWVSSPKRPNRFWVPRIFLANRYRGPLPGMKWPERKLNHSSPFSFEVKNEWSYNSTPPICLHVLDRQIFEFSPFLFLIESDCSQSETW